MAAGTQEAAFMSERNTRHPASQRELIQEFAAADRDNDGRIDFGEFRALLEGLDAGMSIEEIQLGFRELDADRDGFIDCREFTDWWSSD
jgi:Ca2+-binding EF-hand superfamily protein